MTNMLKRTMSDLIQWIFDNLFPSRLKKIIKNILSNRYKDYIKRLMRSGKKQTLLWEIDRLKYRLNNLGFTKQAYQDLEELSKKDNNKSMQKLAAWELALYHANQNNKEDAIKCIKFLSLAMQDEREIERKRNAAILEAECYDLLGDVEKAKSIITSTLKFNTHADLFLAMANLEKKIEERVDWINKALYLYGIAPIQLLNSDTDTTYDRLQCNHIQLKESNGLPKVTVIMPVFNAEKVIETSLNSVLAQTWKNVEVLVVDDCSSDNTVQLVKDFERKDSRVKLILAEKNGGAYVARNLALQVATGEYITVNDADDWSHPEKIEKQISTLIDNPSIMGTTSQQARATEDLRFFRRGKPGEYIFSNMSSFMFRSKPVLEKLGYWDSVRFGADSEFIKRIKIIFGESSIVELDTGPLSFQRQSDTSLTGNSAFGFPGFFMGARKEYTEAHKYYHKTSNSMRYDFPLNERPFAVPEPMWPSREEKQDGYRHFDVIIASDFRLEGGSTMSNIEEIKAQKQMGIRTGLIQLARYDYSPKKMVHPQIREVLDGDKVQIIVFGEKVTCDLLILRYPPILQEWQRYIPKVDAKSVVVIVNQTPMSEYGENAQLRYDIKTCQKRLEDYFGHKGSWYPIGPLVREALHKHHKEELKYIDLAEKDWTNIIDVEEWQRESKQILKEKVVIGRHSRNQAVKWPSNKNDILSAYPESEMYEVRILGGAEVPIKILGYQPKNWHVFNFGQQHPKEFLAELDVFVYYTHSDWVESFGRVIIEAMATGVPVIIPYSYKQLFGNAAVYADPDEVEDRIAEIMNNHDIYKEQVEIATQYVEEHFGYSTHFLRLQPYLRKKLLQEIE